MDFEIFVAFVAAADIVEVVAKKQSRLFEALRPFHEKGSNLVLVYQNEVVSILVVFLFSYNFLVVDWI